MSKGSGSKKKKCSPITQEIPSKTMPKVARTPPKNTGEQDTGGGKEDRTDVAALLVAMEARLSSKLDANKKAVNEAVKMSKLNSDALDALEEKVDATDDRLKETLARIEATEERVLARVEEQVKEMVREQLKAAGFDSQLSAGDLSTLPPSNASSSKQSYAAAASRPADQTGLSKEQRQENKFWECRRSLRLWPIQDANTEGLKDFLKNRLLLDDSFIEEDMGAVTIKRNVEKPKNKDEVCVIFESKQVRDKIKAQGPSLANYREEAGMRLQIPDYLQKDFKTLMALAYDMKKSNKELRRNVKFNEESLGLYIDIQTKREGEWRRIRPQQAAKAFQTRKAGKIDGPTEMDDDEIQSLLGEQSKWDKLNTGFKEDAGVQDTSKNKKIT